jgi:methylenetetrahydrofolate dehydrogenase (NADP+)/methenyltetrahydrofolate cyclohydrolase
MQLLDGKKIAATIKLEIGAEVKEMIGKGQRAPHLATVLVGHDGGSETYVANKIKDCGEVGFQSSLFRFEDNVSENVLLKKIKELNKTDDIDGFIVQLPLPSHISEQKIIESIDPTKDVDGFHAVNVGRMVLGLPAFLSATPFGILELINRYGIETRGKNCVIIGRSQIVGRPLSILLSQKGIDATVTVAHSRTVDIKKICSEADILIAALGSPGFVLADMVKEGATVIDVGTTRVADASTKSGFRLKGDVRFEEVAPKCNFITPVPGGVGPMTRISLLKNTLLAAKKEIYP